MELQDEIGNLVRKLENDYIVGTTTLGKYVQFSQYENVEKIDAYLNSKHTSGDSDSQGRDKPFFNIVTAAVNIWYRATDIDRKNIRIRADKISRFLPAFIAYLHLQQWMRKNNFGQFLNDWGRSLARYGSSVLKFVEKEGELIPSVIPWNRMISDTVDFENNPKVEVLWMTPAQLLSNKNYDQEAVKELLETKSARETTGQAQKDNKSEYIKIYEIHGNLPLSYLTHNEDDEDVYQQQMHVLSFLLKKGKHDEYDDYCLYKGKEAKDPYKITHLIKEDGRSMSIGAVEHLFEAQWMTNHSMKNIKDYLDLASKLIMQTSDGNLLGQNVLTSMEQGDIIIHSINAPLTPVNTVKPDISALQNYASQWQVLAKDITSTPDAMRGETQPSGTAWRQVEALRQESHSLFELMTENKGLAIEDMMREYVIPHIKKQMDTTEEIVADLDAAGISQFDSIYVPSEAIRRDNEQLKKTILSGEVAYNLDRTQIENDVRKELTQLGTQRFIKPSDIDTVTWKEYLKDFEWEVEVDVTSEESDHQNVMDTLVNVLKTVATNPAILQDPNMKLLFNKILDETGAISPLELSQLPSKSPQPTPVGGSNAEAQVMEKEPVNAWN